MNSIGTMSSALVVTLVAGRAGATPPPYTATVLARTGNPVTGTGSNVASSTAFPPNGSLGTRAASVNNSGSWQLDLDTTHNVNLGSTTHEAIVRTQTPQGPFTPYIQGGTIGYLSVPTMTAVATNFYASTMNGSGNGAFAIQWAPDDFSDPAGTAVIYNVNKLVFMQGDAVNVAGVAPGTVWNALDSSTTLVLNDGNQLLVGSTVTEGGVRRLVLVRFQLDPLGNVLGSTLVAKEGGPAAPGGTWTAIAPGSASIAMNNAGVVAFSGTTSAGVDGIFSSVAGFVAIAGGATPVAGVSWGPLLGSPLDINGSGVVAFRGLTGAGSGTYAESSPDAGEVMDQEDHTYGNGPMNLITGTLSNDQDVDMYRVVVTDANAFSATTVPDPGSGFPGAAFDTVLTLIADPGENLAANAGGRTQCDNVSPTVLQSTITGASGRTATGHSYFLAISTPKSRVGKRVWHYATNTTQIIDAWNENPRAVAAGAGLVYWPDPTAGTLRSVTAGGAAQPDLPATGVAGAIAIDPAGGKLYWAESGRIRRANLDGSAPEDLIGGAGSNALFADPATGLALDTVRGRLYWSRSVNGEINSADLNGQNPARVIQDNVVTGDAFPAIDPTGTFAPGALAIDTSAGTSGKIYWVNTVQNSIERCNLSPIGTGRATVVAGAGVAWGSGIAIDSAAGKVYWSSTSAGRVRRANLDGTGAQDVAVTPLPQGLTLDVAGGRVYWTNTVDRVVRSASITGPLPAAAQDVVYVGPDVGERGPDGPGKPYSGYVNGWTRLGAAGTTALPYQIKLTGATFQYPRTILARGNTKIAGVGDAVPGVSNSVLSTVAPAGSAVRMDDRGNVLWSGQYYPVTADNHPPSALFYNQDPLVHEGDIPVGNNIGGQKLAYLFNGGGSMDVSPNGQYAVVNMNMSAPPYVFTQYDNSLLFQFTLPPQCAVDFDGDGHVTVQDIFAFLTAWFGGDPRADFNGIGGVTVQDIFDFLSAWFAGCP